MKGALILKGILSIIVGVLAVAWPGITVNAFVLLFAIYAFLLAGTEAVRAFRSASAGPVVGWLLLALLDIVAGIVALTWPGITALALVTVVAVWAFVAGAVEIALAFRAGVPAGQRALLSLTGLVSIALGIVFGIRPDVGAVTLAQVYGLFSIVYGVSALVMAAAAGQANRLLAPTGN
jgi:uncharacterized membrane protein HdeD (DUF308 family)